MNRSNRFGPVWLGQAFRLLGAGIVLFAAGLALNLFLANVNLPASTSPIGLYHAAWEKAQQLAYDQTKVNTPRFAALEHKYDAMIKTDADAVKYANEMLDELDDHYAHLLAPVEVKAGEMQNRGQFVGIGILLEPQDIPVPTTRKADGPANGPAAKPILPVTPPPVILPKQDADGYPVVKEVIAGGPAEKAGLKNGDAIYSVDGKSMRGVSLEDLIIALRGAEGSTVVIEYGAPGDSKAPSKIKKGTVTRSLVATHSVSFEMKTTSQGKLVGYIRLSDFGQRDVVRDMKVALAALDAANDIVLDLRGNPGGRVDYCINLVSLFLKEGKIVTMRQRVPPGRFESESYTVDSSNLIQTTIDESTGATRVYKMGREAAVAGGKRLIILVNGRSASASEMFTGALKDNGRASVLGTQTFGKGIGQGTFPMPNGTNLRLTTLRYFTPNGTWLGDGQNSSQRFGIEPDIKVTMPSRGDRDIQLERALAEFDKN